MGLDGLNSQAYQYMGGRPGLLGIGTTSAPVVQKNMAEQWAGSAANIGAQQALSHKVDKVVANRSGTEVAEQTGRSYSRLLNLGTDQVKFSEFSWDKLRQTASKNMSGFGQDLKAGKVSPQSYVKETLGQRNFEPIKNLMTGNVTNNSIGQSLTNATGGALVGYDVGKNARDTYKDAKAKEDGSLGSKLNTAGQTTAAVGKYGVRDATSWECASVGASVGKALLPVSIKGVPVGGVLFGALGGVLGHNTMNRVLKTGDLDPVQQRKASAKAEKKAEKARERAENSRNEQK